MVNRKGSSSRPTGKEEVNMEAKAGTEKVKAKVKARAKVKMEANLKGTILPQETIIRQQIFDLLCPVESVIIMLNEICVSTVVKPGIDQGILDVQPGQMSCRIRRCMPSPMKLLELSLTDCLMDLHPIRETFGRVLIPRAFRPRARNRNRRTVEL